MKRELFQSTARPHLPSSVKLWNGDSRGRWEGNTLVVDTTNYNNKGWIATSAATGRIKGIPQSEALHVVERFTRVDRDTINYEVTIDDPNVYTQPWKVVDSPDSRSRLQNLRIRLPGRKSRRRKRPQRRPRRRKGPLIRLTGSWPRIERIYANAICEIRLIRACLCFAIQPPALRTA